jgi:alanyl-tRNA synthetase
MNRQALEVRSMFLNFFKDKGCTITPSASLIPENDSTLLFTSAGMVQFKELFFNKNNKQTKVVSCQKCLRTSDIDKVGLTIRHLTFFEMLGNFSFGDYFKNEAIAWAWEFLTKYIELPKNKLYITVYKDDIEAFNIWRKILGSQNTIIKMGPETNFWDMGTTGPCGPCSEILIDLGDKVGCKQQTCSPTCDCGRYLELWNLVFTQFDKQLDGSLINLPQKNIDTGMGLERIVAVCNNYSDVFESDLFQPIIKQIIKIFISKNKHINTSSVKIIADHIKAAVFIISDGVIPSNEGRGYVLRKILRLAIKQGYNYGYKTPFLNQLVDTIVHLMSPIYPELLLKPQFIKTIITIEEEKFLETLVSGSKLVYNVIKSYKAQNIQTIDGNDIFKLYDTYGVPYDVTEEIVTKHGLLIDKIGFEYKQKISKKQSNNNFQKVNNLDLYKLLCNKINSLFIGYNNYQTYTKVIALIKNSTLTDKLSIGDTGEIILTKTPFYAQGGGQISDIGSIISDYCECKVLEVFKPISNLIVHKVYIIKGAINISDIVLAKINIHQRLAISIHHTTTHLLNAALRIVLGNHIYQEGSLITPKYFHFDFPHMTAITNCYLKEIECMVNAIVRNNLQVYIKNMKREKAYSIGAISLSKKAYAKFVRTVSIKDSSNKICSIELCAGTHVNRTGDIGIFKIISETSIANGIRRIEGVAGQAAEKFINNEELTLSKASQLLNTSKNNFINVLNKYIINFHKMKDEIYTLCDNIIVNQVNLYISKIQIIDKYNFLPILVSNFNMEMLKRMLKQLEYKVKSIICILMSQRKQKNLFLVFVSNDYVKKGISADIIAKKIAYDIHGAGGGNCSFAQGGSTYLLCNISNIIKESYKYILIS